MPRFIVTLFIIFFALTGALTYTATYIPPHSTKIIVLFIIGLWIWIGMFLSFPTSFIEKSKKEKMPFYNPRLTYRKWLKRSLTIAIIPAGFLLMRLAEVFTPINLLLLILLTAVLETFIVLRN